MMMPSRLVFASLLIASTAAADPSPGITLRATGVSAAALAPRIATELGAGVAAAADGACPAPCLDVDVDAAHARATVTFTPAGAAARARAIDLGRDRDAWPELITLLAGNLARDQAADLLADLPAPAEAADEPIGSPAQVADPPAPPTIVTAPPAPELAPSRHVSHEEIDESVFVIGLVPGLSTDFADLHVRHDLALHLAIGWGGGLDGISFAGAADIETGPIDGAQFSGAINVGGDVDGFQAAGAINVARDLDGFQAAGALNVAGDVDGFQAAGAINIARDLDGTQVAGALNVAGDVDGMQIAPINVARRVDGTQIGVINVGGAGDGVSIGLIDIVPGGRTDVEASIDSRSLGTVLLRHGSRDWHNVYGVGGQRPDDTTTGPRDDLWMAGLGLGPTWHTGGTTWDLDAIAWHVSSGAHYDNALSLLNQLRLTVALDVGPVALVAGGALNVYVGERASAPYILLSTAPMPTAPQMDTTIGTHVWPTAFVGVRF